MIQEENIRALQEKSDGIEKTVQDMEKRLSGLTFNEQTAPAKAVMEQMIGELRRMQKNIQAMILLATESNAEGGNE